MHILIILVLATVWILIYSIKTFITPKNGDRENLRALRLYELGEYDKATLEFNKAIDAPKATNKQKAIYLRNLGLVYNCQDKMLMAMECREKAIKLCDVNSRDFYVHSAGKELYADNIDAAINFFNKALEIDPNTTEAHNSLGVIYLGDYDEAYTDLTKALPHNEKSDTDIDNWITNSTLARNYYLLGNYEKAEAYFRLAITKNNNELDCKYSLGLICYYLGKHEESKALFEELIRLNPHYELKQLRHILEKLNVETASH